MALMVGHSVKLNPVDCLKNLALQDLANRAFHTEFSVSQQKRSVPENRRDIQIMNRCNYCSALLS